MNKILYMVEIREVYISSREIFVKPGTTQEDIIKQALDSGDEVEHEYSHTLDSENHTVRELP